MITVLLPTCARPEMLKEALASVFRQSIGGRVDRVIVSENASEVHEDIESELSYFCKSLDPKIDYRRIDPPLPAYRHGGKLFACEGIESKYVAILHDDDFWTPGHLAIGINALEKNPDAVFYGCGHYDVISDRAMLHCSSNVIPWFASGFASVNCAWVLPPERILIANIMGCFSHYSTMIVRTESLREASRVFSLPDADFDNDRMLQFALGRMGNAIYNPIPQVFIRHHEGRDCVVNFAEDERIGFMRKTTQWMVRESGLTAKDILDEFMKIMDQCPPAFVNAIKEQLSWPSCVPELRRIMARGKA